MANEFKEQAFANQNVRLFVWFRVLFNCRFYYPVLAILFVDLGLTLSQYVILNAIWALTIVCLEVPSGALADIIGRKKLVLGSAIIMVAEMALLLFAPLNGGWLLFTICAINRVLAGLAEAAASGPMRHSPTILCRERKKKSNGTRSWPLLGADFRFGWELQW